MSAQYKRSLWDDDADGPEILGNAAGGIMAAAAEEQEAADDDEDHPEVASVVTHSTSTTSVPTATTSAGKLPPPLHIAAAAATTNDGKPLACRRTMGQVCICDHCETTRVRMLHRCNKKRRKLDDDDDGLRIEPVAGPAVSAAVQSGRPDGGAIMADQDSRLQRMTQACTTILECIGEDPNREGLLKTPARWAQALLYMCHGYELRPTDVTNGAVFAENHDEMVVVRNIDICSLCEHHMVPFIGQVHIGYIPNGHIVGLSKLARIAELYARRLQVQERLTRQIADALVETIAPLGVAVVVECQHLCMVMRGVQKPRTVTTTSSVRGCFETNSKTRAEFFSIINNNSKSC